MSVNFNSSVVGNQNTQTSVNVQNCLKKASETLKNTICSQKEDLELSKKCFGENLVKNYNRTGFLKGYYSYDGSINDKTVSLNYEHNKTGLFSGYDAYKGVVGDENTDLKIKSDFSSGNNITGFVGNKEINLTFKNNIFGNYSITGKIGEKEINITKGSDIDSAQGENDILTLVGSLVGSSFNIKDGKFGNLGFSKQVEQQMQQQQMQQQRMQQQRMLHQQMQHQQMVNNHMMGF